MLSVSAQTRQAAAQSRPSYTVVQTTNGTRLNISQEELAQFLGLSRQIVNQYLQAWKAKGWILAGRGNVTITNEPALERLGRESQ